MVEEKKDKLIIEVILMKKMMISQSKLKNQLSQLLSKMSKLSQKKTKKLKIKKAV